MRSSVSKLVLIKEEPAKLPCQRVTRVSRPSSSRAMLVNMMAQGLSVACSPAGSVDGEVDDDDDGTWATPE